MASLFSSIEASSVVFISPFYNQNAEIRDKFVCDVDGKYGKILNFRIGPKIGLIRCSKGDKMIKLEARCVRKKFQSPG